MTRGASCDRPDEFLLFPQKAFLFVATPRSAQGSLPVLHSGLTPVLYVGLTLPALCPGLTPGSPEDGTQVGHVPYPLFCAHKSLF